jgi:hypothetical protein
VGTGGALFTTGAVDDGVETGATVFATGVPAADGAMLGCGRGRETLEERMLASSFSPGRGNVGWGSEVAVELGSGASGDNAGEDEVPGLRRGDGASALVTGGDRRIVSCGSSRENRRSRASVTGLEV